MAANRCQAPFRSRVEALEIARIHRRRSRRQSPARLLRFLKRRLVKCRCAVSSGGSPFGRRSGFLDTPGDPVAHRSNLKVPSVSFEYTPRAVHAAAHLDLLDKVQIIDAAQRLTRPYITML